MALIVNATRGVKMSNQIISSMEMFRSAIGVLKGLDTCRAEFIGDSATVFGANFGITDIVEAQAFSDRWSALLAAIDDPGNAEMAKLRDLIYPFAS